MAFPAAAADERDWLSMDVIQEILRRVDGTTLARAECVCNEFGRIARDDALWENACRSLCPSIAIDPNLHHFISSSFGGFRKFYAHSFPLVLYRFHNDDSRNSPHISDTYPSPSPSDFVSIVDVQYKQKCIYSQVLWGIPDADDLQGWFCNCPFRIDLLSFSSDGDEDAERPTNSPAVSGGGVSPTDREGQSDKFWKEEVMGNLRLKWIVLNRKSKQAVNVCSPLPLGGQRPYSDWNKDFVIRFGSILPPADHNIFPGKGVQCIIVMKCSMCCDEGESGKLEISELGLQLRDMAGGHVNGNNGLLVLENAMGCRRTTDPDEVSKCYQEYLNAQMYLDEQVVSRNDHFEILLVLTGIVSFAVFWCFILGVKNDYVF